jgi:hypothetical protein
MAERGRFGRQNLFCSVDLAAGEPFEASDPVERQLGEEAQKRGRYLRLRYCAKIANTRTATTYRQLSRTDPLTMKSKFGPPMTPRNAAVARVRLIV